MFKKIFLALMFSLLLAQPGLGAEEYAPAYERRAQEVIKGLQIKNGLAGAAFNRPADWELSSPENDKFHLLSVDDPRELCSSWCVNWDDSSPKKLTGLYLTRLELHGTLDLSGLAALKRLSVAENPLSGEFKASDLPELNMLNAAGIGLKEIDLSSNPRLSDLNISYNHLSEVNLEANPGLKTLYFINNQQPGDLPFRLSLKKNQALVYLNLYSIDLESLDLSFNPDLEHLNVADNNLTRLELKNQPKLVELHIGHTKIQTLDLTGLPKLEYLDAAYNSILKLDLSANPALKRLLIYNNPLTELDLSRNPKLVELGIQRTPLSHLDLSHNPDLVFLNFSRTRVETLDLSRNKRIEHFNGYGSLLKDVTLAAEGFQAMKTFYVNGCRFPLSRLAALGDIAQRYSELSPQHDVFFENRVFEKGKAFLDFSGEAVLNGHPTIFRLLTESGEEASPGSFSQDGGRLTITKPGLYKVLMSNPAVLNKSQFKDRSGPVQVYTGLIVVKGE